MCLPLKFCQDNLSAAKLEAMIQMSVNLGTTDIHEQVRFGNLST